MVPFSCREFNHPFVNCDFYGFTELKHLGLWHFFSVWIWSGWWIMICGGMVSDSARSRSVLMSFLYTSSPCVLKECHDVWTSVNLGEMLSVDCCYFRRRISMCSCAPRSRWTRNPTPTTSCSAACTATTCWRSSGRRRRAGSDPPSDPSTTSPSTRESSVCTTPFRWVTQPLLLLMRTFHRIKICYQLLNNLTTCTGVVVFEFIEALVHAS